jgi:hypothetical protein
MLLGIIALDVVWWMAIYSLLHKHIIDPNETGIWKSINRNVLLAATATGVALVNVTLQLLIIFKQWAM